MLYIGRLSAPLVLLYASMAAANQADLRVHHLRTLASTILRLQNQGSTLCFLSPNNAQPATTSYVLKSISDGSTAPANETHGREGHIPFKRFGSIVNPIQWVTRKLRRVSRSSSTTELLAAADELSNELYLRVVIE